MYIKDPGEVVPGVYQVVHQPRWVTSRHGFRGMGECSGCATPIDPRSAPVWSNTYRLASAGALQKVPVRNGLGAFDISSAGVYMMAFGIPAVVVLALFLTGVIKID